MRVILLLGFFCVLWGCATYKVDNFNYMHGTSQDIVRSDGAIGFKFWLLNKIHPNAIIPQNVTLIIGGKPYKMKMAFYREDNDIFCYSISLPEAKAPNGIKYEFRYTINNETTTTNEYTLDY